MEEEAHQRAEALLAGAAGSLMEETGIRPQITVREVKPVQIVRKILAENDDVAALVLGVASVVAPGPVGSTFAGLAPGPLPGPVRVIPGSLSRAGFVRLKI